MKSIFGLSRRVMSQAVCGLFDKSVRTLLHDFGPLVAQLCDMLGQIYTAYPQAPALDLARQVPCRAVPNASDSQSLYICSEGASNVLFSAADGSHICWRGTTCHPHPEAQRRVDSGHTSFLSTRWCRETKNKKKLLRHVEMLFVALKVLTSAAGVQDHPDIAESFMHLHAQVNHTAITYVYFVYTTPPYWWCHL